MSYSFNVRAATKAEAKAAVAAKLDEIVTSQGMHAKDRAQAEAAAGAFIDVLDDNADSDVVVTANGYLSWVGDSSSPEHRITGASFSVSASMSTRVA